MICTRASSSSERGPGERKKPPPALRSRTPNRRRLSNCSACVNWHSSAPPGLLVNINERWTPHEKGHIYFRIYSLNRAAACEPPSISLCHTRRAVLSSYWMLMMSTPAPVAVDLCSGPRPSLMAELLGICCACLLSFVLSTPHEGVLSYWLSDGLIRADMLGVLWWTDRAVAGVCGCVLLLWKPFSKVFWQYFLLIFAWGSFLMAMSV